MFYKLKLAVNLQAYRPVFKSSMQNEIKVQKIQIISPILSNFLSERK